MYKKAHYTHSSKLNWSEGEDDQSPLLSSEFKNEWSSTSSHQYVFIVWHRDNFTLASCSLINAQVYTFKKEFNYCNHRKLVVLDITGINLERSIRPASLCGSDSKGGS